MVVPSRHDVAFTCVSGTQDFVQMGGRYQRVTKQAQEHTYLPLERLCQHRPTDTYLPPDGLYRVTDVTVM